MEEIPAGTYNGQDENVATFGIKCLLCVSENMSDDLVYEITLILYENRDRLKDLHPALSYASQTDSCTRIFRSSFIRELNGIMRNRDCCRSIADNSFQYKSINSRKRTIRDIVPG